MQPIVHPQTELKTKSYLKQPTHALLLTGEEGSGKLHLAKWLATELNLPSFVVEAESDKSAISIDQIRELYSFTKTGNPLLVIIKDAQNLSREAQNAFLKLLEEPPQAVKFVLTASEQSAILPTIASRSQQIRVVPPNRSKLAEHSRNVTDLNETELQSLLYISKGLPGRFLNTLQDEELKKVTQANVAEAKQFYSAESYQRNLVCLEHNYDKEWTKTLLELLSIIVSTLLKSAKSPATVQRLTNQADLIETTATNSLRINGNLKIQLAKLCQQL